ncbi:putative thiol-specific antioxidant related protein/Peroxidoxin BcpB [Actinoplanes philippinensis]|uniref:DNA-binding transcriptional regulator, MerR family n=1 Tax=Actinoplanes philippinensis TaxID=35752 RepID=A0A1I2E0Q2_9ACTN|nr:MerR family transcriptional regulator [Actinoplanes philippinensis]GIE77349.1 putative thiol-specific antioxidant related protein/Peroxidoxin BcpB [Actinoplanes philippinensis]SFE86269.1 DNA-binding transcriptional regulator, MerR family [Actinoplanes philippinensis]
MRVGELARRTGTTIRALRYYEESGLVVPRRLGNGYRDYDPIAERQVAQIRELMALGLTVEETRPFVESLANDDDVCAAAVATFRSTVTSLSARIGELTAQREALDARIDTAARQIVTGAPAPGGEPAGLVGGRLPELDFYGTDGQPISLHALGPGRSIVFVYPLTGRPGVDLPRGLLEVHGARGAGRDNWLRDHHAELLAAGAARVYGLSAQSTGYQRELAHRLRLPYPLIPDPRLTLAAATGLPTRTAGDLTVYERLTLIVTDDVVEHVFHPIPDPASHALDVMRWLTQRRR